MTDVFRRIIGPLSLPTFATTLYTCPGPTATSITNIHVCNELNSLANFTLSIGPDGSGKRYFASEPVYANDVFDWTGLLVLAPGEVIQAWASALQNLTLTCSGVES